MQTFTEQKRNRRQQNPANSAIQRKPLIKLSDNRQRSALQKQQVDALAQHSNEKTAQRKETTTEAVVQRVIKTSVVPDMELPQADTDKLEAVKAYMDTSLASVNTGIKDLYINIADMKGTNPADTKLNPKGTGIVVRVADWFIRISSVGDICGMLAHEIGVHTLADNQMSKKEKQEELEHQAEPFSVNVGLHTHTITPWKDRSQGRQQDHVNVGRDKGNKITPMRKVQGTRKKNTSGKKEKRSAKDVNSINARAIQYAATMLRIGDAIDADNDITQKEKDRRLYDLLNSFLFDYARIIATNDVGKRSLDKSALIAQVYNWYKKVIIARHFSKHRWLLRDAVQPTASNWGMRAYLVGKAAYALALQAKPGGNTGKVIDGIGSAMGYVAGIGGAILGGIGDGISSRTPDMVKKGAGMVGSVISTTLRGIDHVAGEVDNLVVPNVVSAGGWLLGKLGIIKS